MRTTSSPVLQALAPLERHSGVPLYRQLYETLRNAILERRLRSGRRVPATRVLAADLGISRLTVLAAYDLLLHEGYLRGRVGSGTFVSPELPDDALLPVPGRARPPSPTGAGRGNVEEIPAPRNEGGLRPFRLSLPALDRFPHALWASLVVRHARRVDLAQMAYGDPAGLGGLRAAIADHLRTVRAVRCEAGQVIITTGSQLGLRIAAAALLRPGDQVAVEEPGYPGAHVALGTTGAALVPVAVGDDGIDVDALDALGSRVRAVYVTPSHQYPLGPSLSASRRLALLEWARRRGAWIIEDDYDSEYRHVSRPLASLQGMDPDARVVYVGTFSKVLFPALRIGYMVVPDTVREAFLAAREALDLFSPTLPQAVLADFLTEGHFTRHLRRMRGVYQRRREALLDGLQRNCEGGLRVYNADAGLHVATILRRGVSDLALVRRLKERGLSAVPLSSCYLGTHRRQGLLLGFGGSPEAELRAATRVLGELLRS